MEFCDVLPTDGIGLVSVHMLLSQALGIMDNNIPILAAREA